MDFEKAVLVQILAVFCLVIAVGGVLLSILFGLSGHILPEGVSVLVASLLLFAVFAVIRKIV